MFYIGITVKHRFINYYEQFSLSLGKGSLDFRRLPGPVDECRLIFHIGWESSLGERPLNFA